MKIHLKKPSIKGGFAQIEERVPSKPTTSQGVRERGRSVGITDDKLGYGYESTQGPNTSFGLNTSYQHNPNYSVDYGQRNSVSNKPSNPMSSYNDPKSRKKKTDYSPISFYTTNTSGFTHKKGVTKS
jgi:hypothetical protein